MVNYATRSTANTPINALKYVYMTNKTSPCGVLDLTKANHKYVTACIMEHLLEANLDCLHPKEISQKMTKYGYRHDVCADVSSSVVC